MSPGDYVRLFGAALFIVGAVWFGRERDDALAVQCVAISAIFVIWALS